MDPVDPDISVDPPLLALESSAHPVDLVDHVIDPPESTQPDISVDPPSSEPSAPHPAESRNPVGPIKLYHLRLMGEDPERLRKSTNTVIRDMTAEINAMFDNYGM
jgi:hypothetical protein